MSDVWLICQTVEPLVCVCERYTQRQIAHSMYAPPSDPSNKIHHMRHGSYLPGAAFVLVVGLANSARKRSGSQASCIVYFLVQNHLCQ